MEYKVKFSLIIWNEKRTIFTGGAKELLLPFAPFVGLRLQEGIQNYPIASVSWSHDEQCFYCRIEVHEEEMDDGYDLDMKFLIETAKECGWVGFEQNHQTIT